MPEFKFKIGDVVRLRTDNKYGEKRNAKRLAKTGENEATTLHENAPSAAPTPEPLP